MDEQKQQNEEQINEENDINLDLDPTPEQDQPQEDDAPPEEAPLPPDATALDIKPKQRFHISKKMLVGGLLALLVVLIAAGAAWFFLLKDKKDSAYRCCALPPAMGAQISIADGIVQYSTDNKSWQDVKAGFTVKEGSYVRTQQNARAVIAMDDGSAFRLNNNTVVKLDKLNVASMTITNVSGEIYTRIVKSDRRFNVNVAGEDYTAMGTAYKTVNNSDFKGVEVYESKVKLTKNNLEVPEGKYYYDQSKDSSQQKKLTDIPIDKAKQDAFLVWNYQQDKKSSEFKDKLGYLKKVYEPEATPTVSPTQHSSASISLSGYKYDTGVKLNWKLTNVSASNGFKIVKSLSPNPTFGKDDYSYISDSSARSYAWTIKDGKTYHFRVCIYTGSGCSLYSNDITVSAPLYAVPEPSGTLSLTNPGGGVNFSWTLSGSAPNGFKLVWSTSTGPVYPGSSYAYYSDPNTRSGVIDASGGTYHVRVCMYKSGGCVNYSNEVDVVLP